MVSSWSPLYSGVWVRQVDVKSPVWNFLGAAVIRAVMICASSALMAFSSLFGSMPEEPEFPVKKKLR